MAPPPSTPAPHRFLVPKRSATQRGDTPKPLASGSQQFHATPRFSLHSTPREPAASLPSSTPARPAVFVRQRQTDSISDVVDSSPPDLQPANTYSDSIEAESIPASSLAAGPSHASPIIESDLEEDIPSPKRRRLSFSSELDDEPTLPLAENSDIIEEMQQFKSTVELRNDIEEQQSAANSDAPESPGTYVQQPTFHKAPRFIPTEQQEVSTRDPLPDVFSPRRRGTRDVPGGLAAEVRNWLVDIEANTGPKQDGDFIARVSVDHVRRGMGMVLVNGRNITDDVSSSGQQEMASNVRVILAGEGRLIGLARRNEVDTGSIVGIAKPVWEVTLGNEGEWAVACDWVVL